MQRDIPFTNKIIHSFNHAADKHQLTAMEYMVWHALVYTCNDKLDGNGKSMTVKILDIELRVRLKRETIRRILFTLQERGLARKINGGWIFQTVD